MGDNSGGLYNLISAHEKRIASLVVEVEMKDKEIRKWKGAWSQADNEAYAYAERLKSLREAAQYAVDVVSLDPPGRIYHSPQDWEAMKALEAALQEGESDDR